MKSLISAGIIVVTCLGASARGQNLLGNAGFETPGLSGWQVSGNAFAESAAPPRFVPRTGTRLASLYGRFQAGGSTSSISQTVACRAGERHTFSAFGRHFSGDALTGSGPPSSNSLMLSLTYLDAGGSALLTQETVLVDGRDPTNAWLQRSLTAIAPLGASDVRATLAFVQPGTQAGAAHVDDVSLVRIAAPVPTQPLASRIGANGAMEIREVLPDGRQAPWSRFEIRGVAMGWTPAGFFPWTTRAPLANRDLAGVLDELAIAGFNTLRFYYTPTGATSAETRATLGLLDHAWRAGFKVLFTFDASLFGSPTASQQLAQAAAIVRDHPAVLAIALGNEWNLNQGRSVVLSRAAQVETLARALKLADPNRIVVSSLAISPDNDLFAADSSGIPLTTAIVNATPAVDFYGINLYRVGSFHPFFHQWATTTNAHPAAIFENGTDDWDWFQNRRDFAAQALELRRHLEEAARVGRGPGGRAWFAGMVSFAAVDEWWKSPTSPQDPSVQEPGGFFTTITRRPPSRQDLAVITLAEPDGHRSEEHLGLLSLPGLARKPVFQIVIDHHAGRSIPIEGKALEIEACGWLGSNGGLDGGWAALRYEGNVVFVAEGGAVGRGLHLFEFDPASLDVLRHRTFDVFAALSSGGSALTNAIAALDALPTGALVGIAVADALAPSGTSAATLAPLITRLTTRLGATTLGGGIPFRAGYALLGRVGQAPLAEAAPATATPRRAGAFVGMDLDRDGLTDAQDADDDGDGVSDATERLRGTSPFEAASTPFVLALRLDAQRHLEIDVEPGDAPQGLNAIDPLSARLEILTPAPEDLTAFLATPLFTVSPAPLGGLRLRTTVPLPVSPELRFGVRVADLSGRVQAKTIRL